MAFPYYFNLLGKTEQQAYYAIKSGLLELAPSFSVPRLPIHDISELFFQVRLDCPEIFYAVSFHCQAVRDADFWEFIPEYMFAKKQILEQRQIMTARVTKLARGAEKLDVRGKEQYIHDFICSSVHYDKLKKPYSHEIIGALGHGVAVCEGIAKSVKILCDKLEIPCIIAIAEANPEKNIRYRHAWNLVCIEGEWFHLDATFDNTLSAEDGIRYDYFNINDDRVFRDHEPSLYPLPKCRNGHRDWYTEKKLAFSDYDKIRSRAAQAAKKKKELLFRWNGGYLTRDIIQEIVSLLGEEAGARNLNASLSTNLAQSVFRVRFQADAAEDITFEQANIAETEPETVRE